jgi:hypothetical protein
MRGFLALGLLVGCFNPKIPAGAPCPNDICPSGLVCSPETRTCERAAVGADAMVDSPVQPDPPRYRRRITIVNNATTPLPAGFTIRAAIPSVLTTLVSQSRVKSDFSDLRVIGDGAIGERDRIVDPGTGPAPGAISFALQAPIAAGAVNSDYALYYGGPPGSAAPARGTAVFPVYDDFTDGISSIWTRNDGPTASDGKLVLRAGHTDAVTTSASADGVPIVSAMELVASVTDPNSNGTAPTGSTYFYWFGYQHTGDFATTAPWVIWIARGKSQLRGEQSSPVGCENTCEGATVTQNTAPHYYVIERDSKATRFYMDGTLSFTATVTNQADYSIMIRNFLATSDLQVDWVRARARVSPDPTVTVAAEEML